MKDITNDFGTLYYPTSALVFYQSKGFGTNSYVEFFDMDHTGVPTNPHPLTVREANRLAETLKTTKSKKELFLKPTGVLDSSVLYMDAQEGRAVWFTKAQSRNLYFSAQLEIPNGLASVPAMVWSADRHSLNVYALTSNKRPSKMTKLYCAPFFNVHESGGVCMGTVDVEIGGTASLEQFMSKWEHYFFNSNFSHLMEQHNPINGNCVMLWKNLVNTGKPFPTEVLKPITKTLKNLLP